MDKHQKAIRKALIYSAIFQYPLTIDELWHFAVSEISLDKKTFTRALQQDTTIAFQSGYYFFKENKRFVAFRSQKKPFAEQKFFLAQKIVSILRHVPWILFIGITGSLSMENTSEDDDIDLFIITKRGSLWVTRLCVLIILELLGKRRKKNISKVRNTICTNLLIEVPHLAIPAISRNIYTAHEVSQVKPLYNRRLTYETFLLKNQWVANYLPNYSEHITLNTDLLSRHMQKTSFITNFLNTIAQKLQLWYMTDKQSSEIISDTILAFYTNDTQNKVLKSYESGLQKYNLN